MTKKVVWTSCTRLSCACAATPPSVIICLTSSSLLAPVTCPDAVTEMTYAFTTLEATLTKSWKASDACGNPSWSYVFEYDENLLAVPTTALTTAQIAGVFCEGCLTSWIRDEVGEEIEVDVNAVEETVTITSQHGCATAFSIGGGSPVVDWHTIGNTGTVDGVNFCGTTDDVAFTVRTDNRRSRRTEPHTYYDFDVPNILDGSETNLANNAIAATVAGGGIYIQSGNSNEIEGTGVTPTTIVFGSTIGGGAGNIVHDGHPDFTYVSQGLDIDAFDYGGYSTIAGGGDNVIVVAPSYAALGSGYNFIGGGQSNSIAADGGDYVVVGGYINSIAYANAMLDPFYGNQMAADTIVGGIINGIYGVQPDTGPIVADSIGASFIGGGIANQIDNGWASTIGGGRANLMTAVGTVYGSDILQSLLAYNFIGGGTYNCLVSAQSSSIVGGQQSKIVGDACSVVSGGMRNLIYSTNPARDQVISGSSYETIFPIGLLGGTCGQFDTISGGVGNYIEDGDCSAIIGGAFLALGAASAGYQSPTTRTFDTPGDSATPFFPFLATDYSQVDLTAFSDIFYMGDVDLWIGNTNSTAKKVKFFEPNADTDYSSANYSSFRAQAQGANIEYIWPAAAGVAGNSLKIQSVVGTTVTLEWG